MVLNYCSLLGGNTLLWGGRSSEFYRYKVRAFRKKKATKFGQFIDRLLTKKNNPRCRVVGGGFVKIQNAKFRTDDKPRAEGKLACAMPRCEGGKAYEVGLMQNYFLSLHSPLSTLNSEGGHGAKIIGGTPTMLYRRRAAPLIGGAACNCLIGCAESLFFRHCEAWYKPWQSPTFGCGDSEACQGATGLRASKG